VLATMASTTGLLDSVTVSFGTSTRPQLRHSSNYVLDLGMLPLASTGEQHGVARSLG
jgi:hypothetical protein